MFFFARSNAPADAFAASNGCQGCRCNYLGTALVYLASVSTRFQANKKIFGSVSTARSQPSSDALLTLT